MLFNSRTNNWSTRCQPKSLTQQKRQEDQHSFLFPLPKVISKCLLSKVSRKKCAYQIRKRELSILQQILLGPLLFETTYQKDACPLQTLRLWCLPNKFFRQIWFGGTCQDSFEEICLWILFQNIFHCQSFERSFPNSYGWKTLSVHTMSKVFCFAENFEGSF